MAGGGATTGDDPWAAVAATTPEHAVAKAAANAVAEKQRQDKLDQLLGRIANLASGTAEPEPAPPEPAPEVDRPERNTFFPVEPKSFRQATLTESEVEALILKYLLSRGDATGREIADQVRLPFMLLDELLRQMKNDQLVVHRGSAPMNDYMYQLTDMGRERAAAIHRRTAPTSARRRCR